MKSKIILLAIILLGSILPFVTFATSTTDTHTNRISPNIKEGDLGKDWTLKEILSDEAISFRGFYGKVVILDFFATWCGPCIESFAILKDLNAYYTSSQVAIISIDTEYTEKRHIWKNAQGYTLNKELCVTAPINRSSHRCNGQYGTIQTRHIIDMR